MYIVPNLRIARTPKDVGIAIGIHFFLSGESSKHFAEMIGVGESSLFRAMAGKPSKKVASYLGFVEVRK